MNTCIFTTHATLDLVHAEYSLKALLVNYKLQILFGIILYYIILMNMKYLMIRHN
jgi:hypothetical protein